MKLKQIQNKKKKHTLTHKTNDINEKKKKN